MKTEKPLLRGYFHQSMFFITLGAMAVLISLCSSQKEYISVIIYAIGALTLFGVSATYHRINWNQKQRALMKKLDHSAIYIMIAGTMTPISVLGLSSTSSFWLLICIWGVAILGVIQSIFFVNLPKYISSLLYIIAGYLILPYCSELLPIIGGQNIGFLIAGGVAYTLGAICYGLKRPTLNPKYFGYHEVFHIFVNIGATLQFIVIYSLIMTLN